jgi:transcriptional regulator with XRE-family HTH domain
MSARKARRLAAERSRRSLIALGLALRSLREEKGMSVDQLAQASGVPRRSIERIEAAEPDPDAAPTPKSELAVMGRLIRQAREQKGMGVAELAEAAGFKRRSLVRIEAGELDPRMDGLMALADELGVPLTVIVPPDDEPTIADGRP